MDTLVLGGSRFLGRRLVHLLHGQGQSVTVLNRGQTPSDLPPGVARIVADRSEPAQVAAALRGRRFDTVFDISGYRPSELQPVIEALDGNVGSYVFCSSVAVYAPGDVAPIREDAPLNRGPGADEYSRDKVLCEDVLLEVFSRRAFPATIIRPPYVYGPHDYIPRRLFSIFARLTQRRKVIVPGDGLTLTHSVHVEDLASAFAAVPGRSEALGEAYNAVGPEAITFVGFVNAIAAVMESEAQLVHVDPSDYEAMTEEAGPIRSAEIFDFGWRGSSVFSGEKLHHQLGWSPRYDIYDGVEMTYRWWLEQGLDREPWDFSADDRALAWPGTRSKR